MKKIVFINQSAGYLVKDIVDAFRKVDFKTYLLTSNRDYLKNPQYNGYQLPPYSKKSIFDRIKSWLKAYIQIKRFLKTVDTDTYIVFFTNPPFSYFASQTLKNPFSIIIYDLYPDALNNTKCPTFIKNYWAKKNKEIFIKADRIFALSQGMKSEISKYCPENKINVVPLWRREEKPEVVASQNNKFIKEHNLQNKFIVLYSGNMGFTHNIEPLIEAANILNKNEDIMFLLIGGGGKKQKLIELAEHLKLTNCLFLPYLPLEEVKYSLSATSLGVVSVSKETANISVPSKTFNLLSYNVPLLALSPNNSEINRLIKKYDCGMSFTGENPEEIAQWILKCKNDRKYMDELKINTGGAISNFTKQNAQLFVEEMSEYLNS